LSGKTPFFHPDLIFNVRIRVKKKLKTIHLLHLAFLAS